MLKLLRMLANIKSKTWQLALVMFFFVLPFERIPTIEISGFTIKISYMIGILILVLSFFNLKALKLKWFSSDKFLIAFFLISLAATLLNYSTLGTRGLVIISLWLFVFVIYFAISKYPIDAKLLKRIEDALLISTLLICIFGFFQFFGDLLNLSPSITFLRPAYQKMIFGFPRIQSVALEPLYFASFLFFPLFISIKRYFSNRIIFGQYFWLNLLILTSFVLTISRGAYLALGIVVLLLGIVIIFKFREYLKIFGGLILSLIVAVALSTFLIYAFSGKQAVSDFSGHSIPESVSSDGSASNRVETYIKAINLFKTKPVLGVGAGGYGIITTPKDLIPSIGYGAVNNEYLEILAEIGILGLLSFLLFLIFYIKESFLVFRKINNKQQMAMLFPFLALIAFFIQYNFFSTLYIIYIWAFLGLFKSISEKVEA